MADVSISRDLLDVLSVDLSRCGIDPLRVARAMARIVDYISSPILGVARVRPKIIIDHDDNPIILLHGNKDILNERIILYPVNNIQCMSILTRSGYKCSTIYTVSHELCHNIIAQRCHGNVEDATEFYKMLLGVHGYETHPEELLCDSVGLMAFLKLRGIVRFEEEIATQISFLLWESSRGYCSDAIERLSEVERMINQLKVIADREVKEKIVTLKEIYDNLCISYRQILEKHGYV